MDPFRLRHVVALLAVVGLAALPACGGGDDKKEAGQEGAVTSVTTAPAETTTTTAAGPDQTPKELALAAPVNVGNLTVTFHAVTVPYTSTNRFEQPVPGTILATIDTEVKNNGTQVEEFDPEIVLLDSTNRMYNRVISSAQPEAPKGQLAAGISKRGLYVFQLLEGSQAPGLRLVYLPDPDKEPTYVVPLVAGAAPTAPSAAAGDPAKTYSRGEAATVAWGTIVVHGVTNPAEPRDPELDKPDVGFRLITLDVEVFNTTKSTHDAFDLEHKIKDSNNQTFERVSDRTKGNEVMERGLNGPIPALMGIRGPVTFMIPEATAAGPLIMTVEFKDAPPIQFALA
jgi:hypothetical protein